MHSPSTSDPLNDPIGERKHGEEERRMMWAGAGALERAIDEVISSGNEASVKASLKPEQLRWSYLARSAREHDVGCWQEATEKGASFSHSSGEQERTRACAVTGGTGGESHRLEQIP
eukprot:764224-Hanusia_phi.AAC.2